MATLPGLLIDCQNVWLKKKILQTNGKSHISLCRRSRLTVSSRRGSEGHIGLSCNEPVEMMDGGTFQPTRGFFSHLEHHNLIQRGSDRPTRGSCGWRTSQWMWLQRCVTVMSLSKCNFWIILILDETLMQIIHQKKEDQRTRFRSPGWSEFHSGCEKNQVKSRLWRIQSRRVVFLLAFFFLALASSGKMCRTDLAAFLYDLAKKILLHIPKK